MVCSIYLSGGGSFEETYQLDDLFLKNSGPRILYLPVGLKRTFSGYDECVNWFNKVVTSHSYFKKVTVWIELTNKVENLSKDNFDAVYIGGASDTFRLHELLSSNNFYPALSNFVQDGGLIYGGSGGATILGRSINYDQNMKSLPTINMKSLDICRGYSIFAHLNKDNYSIINSSPHGDVIGIPEGGGCVFDHITGELVYLGLKTGIIVADGFCYSLNNGESINVLTLKNNEN